jgi:hypothetical protein
MPLGHHAASPKARRRGLHNWDCTFSSEGCPETVIAVRRVRSTRPRLTDCGPSTDFNLCGDDRGNSIETVRHSSRAEIPNAVIKCDHRRRSLCLTGGGHFILAPHYSRIGLRTGARTLDECGGTQVRCPGAPAPLAKSSKEGHRGDASFLRRFGDAAVMFAKGRRHSGEQILLADFQLRQIAPLVPNHRTEDHGVNCREWAEKPFAMG